MTEDSHSDLLTLLSQNLLDRFHNNPHFYSSASGSNSQSDFIAEIKKLRPLKLSDTYKKNMLTLIKMAPDNDNGLYFVGRMRLLNLQLGFDVDLQVTSKVSAATAPDNEAAAHHSATQNAFFAKSNKKEQTKKQPTETNEQETTQTTQLK